MLIYYYIYIFCQGNFSNHAGYLTSQELIRAAFQVPLYYAAKLFIIEEYGIKEGIPANNVLLPVSSEVDAIRFHPESLLVMREGKVLVQSEVKRFFDPFVPNII